MRRRIAEAAVVLVVTTVGALTACGDDAAPAPPSSGAGSSAGGKGNQGGSTAGDGGDPSAGADANGGSSVAAAGEGNTNGGSGSGGAPTGDAGATTGNGGEGNGPAGGGAGGSDAEPPDLIEITDGPWPDSFTGSCSSTTAAIVCPQLDSPFFGQDGSYRINVPTYSSTATTLTDSVTELMWQLKPAAAGKTQVEAVAYCAGLSLGGHDDWRLPTRLEYVTLLDSGLPNGFALPPLVPTDSSGTQWTASGSGVSAGQFFSVQDEQGTIDVAAANTLNTARCVRGPALAGALTVEVDTVVDSMTKLEWQRTALEDTDRDWSEALAYCESLTHATKTDWRLPSIKELATIVDETATVAPVVSSASFGDSTATKYWSSTPALSMGGERFAITVETTFGGTSEVKMTDVAAARCVRTAD